jgi:adenylate kinase family enzyme
MIKQYIKHGQIVPMEVTIKLVEIAINAALEEGRPGEGWANGKGRFLIDGFPRKMDQALKFDEDVRWISHTCPVKHSVDLLMTGLLVLPGLILYHNRGSHVEASPEAR